MTWIFPLLLFYRCSLPNIVYHLIIFDTGWVWCHSENQWKCSDWSFSIGEVTLWKLFYHYGITWRKSDLKSFFFSKKTLFKVPIEEPYFLYDRLGETLEKSEGYDIYPSVKITGKAVKLLCRVDSWNSKSHCPKHIFSDKLVKIQIYSVSYQSSECAAGKVSVRWQECFCAE